jgi:hypothetical protein
MSAGSQIDFSDLGGKPVSGNTSSPAQGQSQSPQSSQASGSVDFNDLGGKVTSGSVRVIGKDGNVSTVPESQLPVYRARGMMPAADNPGAQKMITPNGDVTYAMPSEVQQFESSGHTKIMPDGKFEVKPLPGESAAEIMNRAVNVGRALGPQQMEQSRKAEQNWWVSKEGLKDEGKGLANVALAGAGTMASLVGGGEAAAGGRILTAARPVIKQVGTGILDEAGKEITREVVQHGPSILRSGAMALKSVASSPTAITAAKVITGAAEAGTLGWLAIKEYLKK